MFDGPYFLCAFFGVYLLFIFDGNTTGGRTETPLVVGSCVGNVYFGVLLVPIVVVVVGDVTVFVVVVVVEVEAADPRSAIALLVVDVAEDDVALPVDDDVVAAAVVFVSFAAVVCVVRVSVSLVEPIVVPVDVVLDFLDVFVPVVDDVIFVFCLLSVFLVAVDGVGVAEVFVAVPEVAFIEPKIISCRSEGYSI